MMNSRSVDLYLLRRNTAHCIHGIQAQAGKPRVNLTLKLSFLGNGVLRHDKFLSNCFKKVGAWNVADH